MASTSSSGRREQERDPFLALEHPNKKIKSFVSAKQFDVFINHRGPDVKTTLALQLYNSLEQAGIRTYLDCEETELGDSISSTIKNAIFSAAVHIAIFSPRYAESAWCLAELALMFQTRARIIPLFYHVHPSDFRHIKNRVADAFSNHEQKGRYPHDIQRWKECLQNVSGIKGYELNGQNDDLNLLCNDVVSAILKMKEKKKIPLQVAKYEVGLDELVKDFHNHCQRNGQLKDKIIGIFGMGGSGKTTLSKDLFNRKHSEFSESTILFDVREKHVKDELTSLQSKLLNDLFPKKHHKICSKEEGTACIKHELERSRQSEFLIVIDDVDAKMQLDVLLPIDALNPNSLVIVTTRDERVLIQAGFKVRYKMKAMNPQHSRELFCWHAFHRKFCKRGYENLVHSFVEACGGSPLALQVMGGHVFGSDKDYWKLQLEDVKARLHKDIKHTLKISYDALEKDQKQIFMDIACFFIGEEVSTAVSIWKGKGWRAEHALHTLKDKCLVEVEETEWQDVSLLYRMRARSEIMPARSEVMSFFRMHDHLRDLGREMADDKMNHPCRLWRPKDLIGMQKFKGLQDILMGSEGKCFRCFNGSQTNITKMTYFLESSKTSTHLQWLDVDAGNRWGYESIPQWIPLHNLQTLTLRGTRLKFWQRDDQAPLKLKELRCYFRRPYLIAKDEHERNCHERNCNEFLSLLGMFKHLESLSLNFGERISESDIEWYSFIKSVRELPDLKTLDLSFFNAEGEISLSCKRGTTDYRFPMRSLEAISLYGIFDTRKVSISGQLCPTLKSIKLYFMKDLIEVDLTGVIMLECLELLGCRKLRKVLCNDLLKLDLFRIRLCRTMKELPNFWPFNRLNRIYISCCWNLQSISAIEGLKGLKRILIADCPKLQNIKDIEQCKGLNRIWIEKCPELQGTISVKELNQLKRILIRDCQKLQNIEGIELLICLKTITITACPKLQNLKGIEELKGLKEMIISESPTVSCVERLQILPSELTILVGRPAVSYLNADKIGDVLSMADGSYEMESEQQLEEMIHSLRKTQHSLRTFIFCAMLDVRNYGFSIRKDVCMANSFEGVKERENLCLHGGMWIYMCVLSEEMLSKYKSRTPPDYGIWKGFLMGMKEGPEGKSLDILQRLFTLLCDGDCNGFLDSEDGEHASDSDEEDEECDEEDEECDEEDEFDGYYEHDLYDSFTKYDNYAHYDDYDDEDEEYDSDNDNYDGDMREL